MQSFDQIIHELSDQEIKKRLNSWVLHNRKPVGDSLKVPNYMVFIHFLKIEARNRRLRYKFGHKIQIGDVIHCLNGDYTVINVFIGEESFIEMIMDDVHEIIRWRRYKPRIYLW